MLLMDLLICLLYSLSKQNCYSNFLSVITLTYVYRMDFVFVIFDHASSDFSTLYAVVLICTIRKAKWQEGGNELSWAEVQDKQIHLYDLIKLLNTVLPKVILSTDYIEFFTSRNADHWHNEKKRIVMFGNWIYSIWVFFILFSWSPGFYYGINYE